MKHARLYALLIIFFLPLSLLWGQLRPSSDTTVIACSGLFFDSGGQAGNYGPGQRYVVRFCPPAGSTAMRLAFGGLDIGSGDSICIYDGSGTGAVLLGCITAGRYPDTLYFQSTVNNSGGCLRVEFSSNGSGEGSGWAAVFSCGLPCQDMRIRLDSIEGLQDRPGGVFGACLGKPVNLRIAGIYPQNGIQYTQSDAGTMFTWFLEGDSISKGRELYYVPERAGGINFYLKVQDSRGCRFQFPIQEILVPPRPVVSFPRAPDPVCPGDTIRIGAAIGKSDTTHLVNVLPQEVGLGDGRVLKAPISALRWRFQPGVLFQSRDSLVAVVDTAGLTTFLFSAEDDFGCIEEAGIGFPVRPINSPACGTCRTVAPFLTGAQICAGDSLRLDARLALPTDSLFYFRANPQYALGFANHPHTLPYASALPVASVPLAILNDPRNQIRQVCLTIATDWAEDLHIFLRAPDGRLLELSTGNGGGFDDYRNTCFTPTATMPITTGEAPFSGTFRPEGNWDVLRGAEVNGTWALLVSDGFDPLRFGRVETWNITFAAKDSIQYLWSPAQGLSCADCPAPVARPARSTVYYLQAKNAAGCNVRDSIRMEVLDSLVAPVVQCRISNSGSAVFSWGATSGAVSYAIRITQNGRDSSFALPASQTDFVLPALLRPGEQLVVRIRADGGPCGGKEGTASCTFRACTVDILVDSLSEISCFGRRDGAVVVRGTNGSGDLRYQLNGGGSYQSSPRFGGLGPGRYFVTVIDKDLCTDTVFFELKEPLLLQAEVRLLAPISCATKQDGAMQAFVSGGTAPFAFSWSNGKQTAVLDSLAAGDYRVTVSDIRGCRDSSSLRLLAPSPVILEISGTAPSCNGKQDATLSATASGGTGALKYLWNTGAVNRTISGIGVGQFCVEVSDARNCKVNKCLDLVEPPLLRVDSVFLSAVDCPGGSNGTASVLPLGGTAPYAIIWSDPLAQAGRQATRLAAGPVQVRVTDAKGCTLVQNLSIPSPDSIRLTLLPQAANCFGEASGTIKTTVSGGTVPYTFSWSNGSNKQHPEGLIAGEYRVTTTDAKGCSAVALATVEAPQSLLIAEIIQESRGCIGEKKNTARVRAMGGNPGSYTFRWSNGMQTSGISGLDSVTYSVTVTDAKGCVANASLKMSDLPPIDPNMIVSLPSCFNGNNGAIGINFIRGRPGADLSAYRFSWSTGTSGTTIGGLKGDREYTVTVTDPQGCTAVVTRYLRQPRPLAITLGASDATCPGARDGSVSVVAIEADTRNFSYTWSHPGSGNTRSLSALAAGTYRVTVTDEFNCTGEAQAIVNQPVTLSMQFVLTANRCFGDSTGAAQIFGNGGTPPYRFTWPDGSIGNARTGLKSGTYEVLLTDAKGCKVTSPAILQAPAPMNIRLGIQRVTCFDGRDGVLQIAVSGGKAPYQYSTDGKNFRSSPTIIGLKAGKYAVAVQDANACTASVEAVISEPPPFIADAGPPAVSIKLGDTLVLKAVTQGEQGRVKYTWIPDFPGTLSCTQCESAIVLTQNTISYVLQAVDSAGCEARDRITVNVRKDRDILVPTGFSPNGDGNNDLLLVHGLNGTRILRFRVFDRWGELVYERSDFVVNDPAVGWDGTFRGQPLNPGVFVWYMEAEYIDGYRETKRGQTTLIK